MLTQQRKQWLGALLPILMLLLSTLACDLEQSMGELNRSQTFTAEGGWDYDWYAQVIPGKKYEVKITPIGLDYTGAYLVLKVKNGLTCDDCVLTESSALTIEGVKVRFIAPEFGRVGIYVYVREGTYDSLIEIREITP